jgi:prepilin-type N-terminal cleavage/methylation domain-containing protein
MFAQLVRITDMTVIRTDNSHSKKGYTLVEVIISVLVLALVGGSLFAGLAAGFSLVQSSREDTRATQIMVEKMETVRLQGWSNLASSAPNTPLTSFQPSYFADGSATNPPIYQGTIQVSKSPPGISGTYLSHIMAVTVTLQWTNGSGVMATRKMQTLVAEHGM